MRTTKFEIEKEIKNFKTTEEYIDYKLSEMGDCKLKNSIKKEYTKFKLPFYTFFKDRLISTDIIEKEWDDKIINKTRVKKAMILSTGRNYEDGFSGIRIKKYSYGQRWTLEVIDGTRGQVFIKTYLKFPTKQQVKFDSMLGEMIPQDFSLMNYF